MMSSTQPLFAISNLQTTDLYDTHPSEASQVDFAKGKHAKLHSRSEGRCYKGLPFHG